MNYYPHLLIISGTSGKSGKTSMACRLIEKFRDHRPVAIKVSSHFHEGAPGLITVDSGPGYTVYEETDSSTEKDTSRMLRAGALRVFLVLAWEADVESVFRNLIDKLPQGQPIICESATIRKYFEPGAFIIMNSDNPDKRQDVAELRHFPHLEFSLQSVDDKEIPVKFESGNWK